MPTIRSAVAGEIDGASSDPDVGADTWSPAPSSSADQPLAVGSSLIATSQTVGLQADVSLVGLDRSAKATVPADIPAASKGTR